MSCRRRPRRLAVECRSQFVQRGVDRVPGRDHQPDPFLRAEFPREIRDGRCRSSAGVCRVSDALLVDIEDDDFVAGFEYAVDDDAAHASESNDAKFHTEESPTEQVGVAVRQKTWHEHDP